MSAVYDSEAKIWNGIKVPYSFPMDLMIGDLILKKLAETPDRIVQITAADDKAITCEDLRISSIRVAQNLQKIGVKPDDVVALIAPQSHFATYIINGCIIMGALINPVHMALSEEDICHVFSDTKPKVIICVPEAIQKVQRALKDVSFNYRIYSTSTQSSLFLKAQNFLKPTGIEESFQPPKFSKLSNEKVFAIICSSGTTGSPKGVCISNISVMTFVSLLSFMISPTDITRSYCLSPMSWATGFFINFMTAFSKTEIRIIPDSPNFTVENFLEIAQKYQITSATMNPWQLSTILNCDQLSSFNLDSLTSVVSGGSIVSKTLRELFFEKFPEKDLLPHYGMTEVGVTLAKPGDYKNEFCVGSMIFPNSQIKIVDDEGNALDNGQTGEVYAKHDLKFLGYYNNAEATRNATDENGFFKTGDVGYFNDEGMLFIVDRKKDILKYKGHHVNSSEIENVIQSIDGVELVSVVGIPDDICNSLLTAAIVKRDNFENLTEQKIVDHLDSILPIYKQLHGGVHFFDKLPMTPSGKIQKKLVLEEIMKCKKS